jgi:hypothetical protein
MAHGNKRERESRRNVWSELGYKRGNRKDPEEHKKQPTNSFSPKKRELVGFLLGWQLD